MVSDLQKTSSIAVSFTVNIEVFGLHFKLLMNSAGFLRLVVLAPWSRYGFLLIVLFAYGMIYCPSVVCLSITLHIVAKGCIAVD